MTPDKRRHRGPNQKDLTLFKEPYLSAMRKAADEYQWLLNRNYPKSATLKLVGDRYALTERQRLAIARSICSDDQRHQITLKLVQNVEAQHLYIDGFNIVITMEALICGAPVLRCSDQTLRDLSGVYGSYHKIAETPDVIRIFARGIKILRPASINWYFDRPVSNSGRLAALVRSIGEEEQVAWNCLAIDQVDQKLCNAVGVVVTSDSGILLHCKKWFNLLSYVIKQEEIEGWYVNLMD